MSFEDKGTKRSAENIEGAPKRRTYDGETREAFSDQTEMDPKLWNKLGEDLLEKIISRLPLKDLVQSQALSKKWRSRFQSPSFQKEVSAYASEWGPCNFYHPLCVTEKGLCGYDRSTQKWKDLCTLPGYPPDFNGLDETDSNVGGSRWRLWGSNCFVVGPLVFAGHLSYDNLVHIFVTNVVNKTNRRLPPLQLCPEDVPFKQHFVLDRGVDKGVTLHPVGHDHYKMVMFSRRGFPSDIIIAAVYDSKSNSWTKFHSVLPRKWINAGDPVYLKGVVYFPYCPDFQTGVYEQIRAFWTFDVENGLFAKIFPRRRVFRSWIFVAWQSELLLVSNITNCKINRDLTVHAVNLKTLKLIERFRGPPNALDGWLSKGFVISDSDSIHLILEQDPDIDPYANKEDGSDPDVQSVRTDNSILDGQICLASYDVKKQLWSYSYANSCDAGDARIELCEESAFQPNLCPFVIA